MHTFDTLDKLAARYQSALDGRASNVVALDMASVVIVGDGEAALAGALFRAATLATSTVPVVCIDSLPFRDGPGVGLPRFVGPGTLVIVMSDTGSDQTAVDAVAQASDAGARIAVVTPGGRLAEMADAQAYPCRTIPGALVSGAPLLGELFFGLWGLMAGTVILPSSADVDARAAIALVGRQRRLFGPEASEDSNPARLLARAFHGRMPLIYGTSTIACAAADIWADRLQRTGHPARAGSLDVDADVDRWPAISAVHMSTEALVLIDGAVDPRFGRLQEALGDAITCNELSFDGHTPLERLWGAVHLADWTSFYLAP